MRGIFTKASVAHSEQTDAMTLWVAERTLRQYGLERLADDVVATANEIAQGRIPHLNEWPRRAWDIRQSQSINTEEP